MHSSCIRILASMACLVCLFTACLSSREFWTYAVDDKIDKTLPEREQGTVDKAPFASTQNIKIVYNDGTTSTEVQIPMLTSGQQVLIDHKNAVSTKALTLMPMPPTEADTALEDTYMKKGQTVDKKAAAVSIVKTLGRIRELVREGNLSLALEYAEQLLRRYPNHVETLKIKGSLLLKMGEKDAAIKAYQKAQDLEPDPRVENLLNELEK